MFFYSFFFNVFLPPKTSETQGSENQTDTPLKAAGVQCDSETVRLVMSLPEDVGKEEHLQD